MVLINETFSMWAHAGKRNDDIKLKDEPMSIAKWKKKCLIEHERKEYKSFDDYSWFTHNYVE